MTTGKRLDEVMASMSKLPRYPIPDVEKLREMLIEQILDFQLRYNFSGTTHTKESLGAKSNKYLERLCNMQLFGIASSKVISK